MEKVKIKNFPFKERTREEILESLKAAEMEEGRTGLVNEFLAKNPENQKKEK